MRRAILFLLLLAVEPNAFASRPPHPTCALYTGEVWSGSYHCGQGDTALDLHVTNVAGNAITAEFAFNFAPDRVQGRYSMTGTCNGTQITFVPQQWITRPAGYEMVGMRGTYSNGAFQGTITNPACSSFYLRRAAGTESR